MDSCRRTCGRCVWTRRPRCQIPSPEAAVSRLEHRRGKAASAPVRALTYFSRTCTALCCPGLTVASNRGRKMFSKILAKCGISFFDLKMSLRSHNHTRFSAEQRCSAHLKGRPPLGGALRAAGHLLDPGNLDHPPHVGGVDPVLDEPVGQVLPLAGGASVDGQAGLHVLVLAVLQLFRHLLQQTTGSCGKSSKSRSGAM